MEEFIEALMKIDNAIQNDIKNKLKHNIKLNEYEENYLIQMHKFLERRKKINCRGDFK